MATPRQIRRRGRFAFLTAVVVGALAVATGAFGYVSTDQADYSPGSVVTISGGNDSSGLPGYVAGNGVVVDATADNGLWEQTCSAMVAADETWSCQVTLSSDPAIAVGSYTYTATSTDANGNAISETGTFTDATQTDTTVASSLNPSTVGQSVTFTATVKSGNPATNTVTTGQVKFGIGGNCTGGFTTELQAAQDVNASGQVTYTTASLPQGSTTILACYIPGSGLQKSDDTVTQVVNASPKLAFTTSAFSQPVGACFGPITVQTQTSSGTPSNVASDTTINLATDNGTTGAGAFYSDDTCTSSITSRLITTGTSSTSFYYMATHRGSGSHLLTASTTGYTNATQTETITKAYQATLSVTGPSSGQYSDVYAMTYSGGSGTGAVTYTTAAGTDACTIPVSPDADAGLLVITMGSTGTCTIQAHKAGDNDYYPADSANFSVTTNNEDATVGFGSGNPDAEQVTTPGGNYTGSLSFGITVKEKTPDSPTTSSPGTPGGRPGDISLVTNSDVSVSLSPIGGGASYSLTCGTAGVLIGSVPSYTAYETFTCTYASGGTGIPVGTYEVGASLGGHYYTGSGVDAFTVYDPSLGFATGGGWFLLDGDKVNFGFTMKYGKNGSNLKGNFIAVRHYADGTTARLKSNSLNTGSLAITSSGGCGQASFSGKATYTDQSGTTTGGNPFTVWAQDCNNPGTGVDSIWLGGTGDLSMLTPISTYKATLGGGNIAVPHTTGKK